MERSRAGGLSAAVVFLPEGSKDFGVHDAIPAAEKAQGLGGECWCVPLYGKKRPWGCRWWTRWIANIEKAVKNEAELQVYFFAKMKGKGKVQSFATAGAESLRREALQRKKKKFLKTQEFQRAQEAGLDGLCKKSGNDSSSQYSREVHRLFLAWLPNADREFLEASEGLGNSQKAEVAWLERKGYAYTEVEIDVAEWVEIE